MKKVYLCFHIKWINLKIIGKSKRGADFGRYEEQCRLGAVLSGDFGKDEGIVIYGRSNGGQSF